MQEVKFETLVASIGISLQKARKIIENENTDLYFEGYHKPENSGAAYTPITRPISIPAGNAAGRERIIEVPLTALENHSNLMLDSVDINLKFTASEKDGELYIGIKSDRESDEAQNDYSEMSLHFKKADASEGIARLTDQAVKLL